MRLWVPSILSPKEKGGEGEEGLSSREGNEWAELEQREEATVRETSVPDFQPSTLIGVLGRLLSLTSQDQALQLPWDRCSGRYRNWSRSWTVNQQSRMGIQISLDPGETVQPLDSTHSACTVLPEALS